MPALVSRMSTSSFIMKLVVDEKNTIDVTVTGRGLKFDTATGAILQGEIEDISLSSKVFSGRSWVETEVRSVMGIEMNAGQLGEMFGTRFWNEAKLVVDAFDKFQTLHDGISSGLFSKAKNVVEATEQSDVIRGYKYNDRIEALAGHDDVYGGAGNDSLFGGKGNDMLDGGAGNDLLIDRDGHNTLSGGAGKDILVGGRGVDVLNGGTGDDILLGGGGYDRLTGGTGRDQFVFNSRDAAFVTITDFADGDLLVNQAAGTRDDAWRLFEANATQSGRHTIYDDGEFQMILRNVKLSSLDASDFADATRLPDAIYS